MRQSTLHQLKVFETVARLTSITRAAEELSLTQPTVSMQIKQLTPPVGVPLFAPLGPPLSLPPAGPAFLVPCRALFARFSLFSLPLPSLPFLPPFPLPLSPQ
ncbi:helix-turn-helix domain-containing protein [Chamaesiphon polymorphus]|uniref:HTH lysR-type domain-containing protein n=1 Tax=Chamaesiphon polymorphus CCALA 037 TaxID=2107692 RepID=A0A2T1G1G9_9CYAN|nr:hypothetical protein C7B77_22060 [Chamaesiphon polymorphus CCALA 037]